MDFKHSKNAITSKVRKLIEYFFGQNKSGATAVEFALVIPLFAAIIVFIMVVAAILFINQALDAATSRAARLILTGNAQSSSMTQATFTQQLCNNVAVKIKCEDLIVNLYNVSKSSAKGYLSFVNSDLDGLIIPPLTPGSGNFNLGIQGEYQYLIVVYPLTIIPTFLKDFFKNTTYKGLPAYLAVSTAVFKNEKF